MPRTRLALVLAAAMVLAATAAHSQTLTPVYQYSYAADDSLGGNPQEGVTQASDGNLYALSYGGGSNANGSVLQITPAGVGSLFFECSAAGTDCSGINDLIQLPDGNFWGTSSFGGANGFGNIFTISLGGVFTDKYDFANDQYGAYPNGEIVYVESCDCIYGTTIGTNAVNSSLNTAAYFGTVFSYKVGLTSGTPGIQDSYEFGLSTSNIALGVQPVAGVTVVGGNVYGSSQVGIATGSTYGVLWYFNSTLSIGTILHAFTDGTDGAYPTGAPRYYKPDGNIYGTTLQNDDNQPDSGSIYKSGLTSGFAPVFTFTDTAVHNMQGAPAFDTAGNLIVTAGQGGANGVGALYLEPRAGGTTITTLFDFATGSIYGDHPQSVPFFDNTSKLWTVQLGGTDNLLGSEDEWTLSTETAAPIKITVTPATAAVNTNVTIAWSATNAFSDEEQLCWASGGNSGFKGVQTGTYANGVYSGSKTVNSGDTQGAQTLTIVCGGRESASATLQVGGGSGPVATTTTVTASPNPVVVGNNVTVSATVKKSSGTGTPTGSVIFKTGTTVLATVDLNGSGVAKFTAPTTGYPAGKYPLTATYSGDTNDDASSGSTTLTVSSSGGPVATTIIFSPTPNPVTVGNNLDLDATVTRNSGSGFPTGTVTFKEGTTTLATGTLGASGTVDFRTSTTGFTPGSYPITATYNGDANDLTSTSTAVTVVVTKVATTTALTASATSVTIGSPVTLTATVTPAMGTTTGNVNFMEGTTLLATVALKSDKAVLTATTKGYPAGTYPIHAVYVGSTDDAGSTSNTVNITLHN